MKCSEAERKLPDFRKAVAAECEAIRNGNYHFPGIGWLAPGEVTPPGRPEILIL